MNNRKLVAMCVIDLRPRVYEISANFIIMRIQSFCVEVVFNDGLFTFHIIIDLLPPRFASLCLFRELLEKIWWRISAATAKASLNRLFLNSLFFFLSKSFTTGVTMVAQCFVEKPDARDRNG